ncbi:hypothetical protein EJB05_27281, partial [Eragrostis curvula]
MGWLLSYEEAAGDGLTVEEVDVQQVRDMALSTASPFQSPPALRRLQFLEASLTAQDKSRNGEQPGFTGHAPKPSRNSSDRKSASKLWDKLRSKGMGVDS